MDGFTFEVFLAMLVVQWMTGGAVKCILGNILDSSSPKGGREEGDLATTFE